MSGLYRVFVNYFIQIQQRFTIVVTSKMDFNRVYCTLRDNHDLDSSRV